MNELWGTVAILGGLGGLMLGVRALQTNRRISPEIARKTVHVGMGCISLPLPWVYPDPRPIWIVATLVVLFFIAVRCVPALAAQVGGVLGGVSRFSLGEIYYPIGTALAFAAAHDTPFVFCGAMGVLAFGDTAGAVVGTRWGRRRYAMPGGIKSLEGSFAVLLVSSACAGGALWASAHETPHLALAGGFYIGLIAALVEASACRGLDNLVLPIVVVGLVDGWAARAEHPAALIASLVGAVLLFLVLIAAANGRIWCQRKNGPSEPAAS